MLVGEAYGSEEDARGEPFVGASGQELNRMLHEAGIMRSECYLTNLVNARPPNNDLTAWIPVKKSMVTPAHVTLRDKKVLPIVVDGYKALLAEIGNVQPSVIVAFGNSALWALTGKWGVTRWRGSVMPAEKHTIIPTIHPAAVLREWSARPLVVNDLRRAKRILEGGSSKPPPWRFIIRPSLEQTLNILQMLWDRVEEGPFWIDFDLETRLGHIECAGLSWSRSDAICIPFLYPSRDEPYWNEKEEALIVWKLYCLLTHSNARVRGQNLLYDAQYTYRHWLFVPRVAQDTMISWHVAFAGMPKRLDFQASLLCDYYIQWKPDRVRQKEGG
jgi:DNA polymerase